MTPDASAVAIAIAGMALVTFAIRAGGLIIARALPPTPFVIAFLRHLGSSVIVALIVSTLWKGDLAGVVATAVTVALAAYGRPTTGLFVGMAVAALLRL